jgi:hypothetical protein
VCRHQQSLKKSENQASDAPDTFGERKNPDVHSVQQFYSSNIFSKWYNLNFYLAVFGNWQLVTNRIIPNISLTRKPQIQGI